MYLTAVCFHLYIHISITCESMQFSSLQGVAAANWTKGVHAHTRLPKCVLLFYSLGRTLYVERNSVLSESDVPASAAGLQEVKSFNT